MSPENGESPTGCAAATAGFLRRRGFLILILGAFIAAVLIAALSGAPDPIPSFALYAEPVYRAEIGLASFVAFYLAIVSLVLALNNRAFIKLGTAGVEAQSIIFRQAQQQTDQRYGDAIAQLGRGIVAVTTALGSLENRLEQLEKGPNQPTSKGVDRS